MATLQEVTKRLYPGQRYRLADLYLLYAEALNEVNGPGTETYRWIDEVRTRAGLPGVAFAGKTFRTKVQSIRQRPCCATSFTRNG